MKSYLLRMIWPTILIGIVAAVSIFGDHDKVQPTLFYSALGVAVCFAYMLFIDYARARQDLEPGYLESKRIEAMDDAMDRTLDLLRRQDKRDGVDRTDDERKMVIWQDMDHLAEQWSRG